MKTKALFLFLFLLILACDSNENAIPNPDNLLIGSWVDPYYNENETVFKRAPALPNNGAGIMFKANGDFVERSSGWCGTPPLSYSDYKGNWVLENTLVTITQEFYPINYAWRIVSVSETELIVKRELTEQEIDHQKLMDLYNEIYNLSISVSCTNANDWLFTAYGAKACGGPQGYIAYSNQIDTDAFLQKVEAYNAAETAYNIKWDIVSTCDLPQQPKGVKCQNGFPLFIY
ncbi:hypothetical protein [Gelatiniphilus marinus]|uniref:Lipocalin-like domain-containing protein n=1 Tax=Gelatiniphilus marinus TaxID=1759464 RepID=A0ABW5JVV8_9FLAO